MQQTETPLRGPGWGDVRDYLEELGRRWGGNWVCSVRLTTTSKGRVNLWALCERFGPPGKSGFGKDIRAGHCYPTSDRIAMPALLHGLLAELELRLEDDKGLAERQAAF